MRITAVGVHGDDGCVHGDQVFAAEGFENPLLHFVFVRAAIADAAADFLESSFGDRVNRIARGEVGGDLLFGQRRLEQRNQVAGTDDVLSHPADQVEGAAHRPARW